MSTPYFLANNGRRYSKKDIANVAMDVEEMKRFADNNPSQAETFQERQDFIAFVDMLPLDSKYIAELKRRYENLFVDMLYLLMTLS